MQAVIARTWLTRYSHLHRQKAGGMADQKKRAELERRIEAGEWLTAGHVAIVLDVSRSSVVRMLDDGKLGFRKKPGSRYRMVNPAEVKQMLEESRQEHRGTETPAED